MELLGFGCQLLVGEQLADLLQRFGQFVNKMTGAGKPHEAERRHAENNRIAVRIV